MKKQRLLSIFLAVATVMSCFITSSVAVVTKDDFTTDALECSSYDIRKYTDPFWEGNIVYNEIVHPIRNEDGSLPSFELMYDASEIISVKNYELDVTYEYGKDYLLINGNLFIISSGSIPVMDYTDMHPLNAPPGYGEDEFRPYYPHADKVGYEYWTGGSDICEVSLAVTYIHNDTWDAPIQESQQSNLPKTFEKLQNDEDLTIVVAGDSVATGAMGSAFLGMSPYADAYPEMAANALKEKYSNDGIKLINSAIGGTMSDFDEAKMNSTIINHNPDLVIINFGMNDSSCNREGIPKSKFKANNALQIEYIQEKLPDCEILLLSSLYGNRYTFPAERYEEHAAALHELASEYEGVGVADPQRIEKYLIEETGKDYICFMADNMVHPGDLGMRLMAQTIIEALSFEDISEYRSTLISQMTEYADPERRGEEKESELLAVISETETAIASLGDEWDINEVVDAAYEEIDTIILRCDVHKYEDTVIAPTCKAEGYTHSVCTVCGYEYDHDTVPNLGGEHVMDSGRQTTSPTYKTAGEITYSCARCDYTEKQTVPILSNAPTLNGQGMVHIGNDHNYMVSDIEPYTTRNGYVEFDVCPISIEKYDGTPYVGVWFSSFSITACYNFRTQRAEIIATSLPFSSGTVYASADYEWTSDGGEYEYNWKKFAFQIKNNTVKIFIDGELIVECTNSDFSATDEVGLVYTNGELYFDNFKIGRGNYDPTTGTGGTTLGSWDFNSTSSYNSFFSEWGQQYATKTFVRPTSASVTTGKYAHTHSGTLLNTLESGCAEGGYREYTCSMCGVVYRNTYTDPLYESGHTLINPTITKNPTKYIAGERTYDCETCDMTFTEIIPKGTVIEGEGGDENIIYGDVNNDLAVNFNDYTILNRFTSGAPVEVNVSGSDINGDGNVNFNDLILLNRILSGANVVS